MLLNSISLTPDTAKGFPKLSAEISASTYLPPPTQGLTAGATPGPDGPAAGATHGAVHRPRRRAAPPTTTATIGVTR